MAHSNIAICITCIGIIAHLLRVAPVYVNVKSVNSVGGGATSISEKFFRADEAHHRVVNHTLGDLNLDKPNPFGPGE